MHAKTLIAGGLLTAAALAGCGASAGRTAAHTGLDQQIARRSVLTLRDFPRGWKQTHGGSINGCDAFVRARRAASAVARSAVFVDGDNTETDGAVYVFRDDGDAAHAFGAMTSRAARLCYADKLVAAIKGTGQVTVRGVKTAVLALDPADSRHAAGRVTVSVSLTTKQGVQADLFVDLVFVRERRGLSLALFSDALTPFDETLRARLTADQAGRLARALT